MAEAAQPKMGCPFCGKPFQVGEKVIALETIYGKKGEPSRVGNKQIAHFDCYEEKRRARA